MDRRRSVLKSMRRAARLRRLKSSEMVWTVYFPVNDWGGRKAEAGKLNRNSRYRHNGVPSDSVDSLVQDPGRVINWSGLTLQVSVSEADIPKLT